MFFPAASLHVNPLEVQALIHLSCVAKVCVFWFDAAFNSFPVIPRRCLVATGSSMLVGGSHFYTCNSGFPCAFICLSFMLMAVDFSRTQKGYSVHVFNLYYIVIDLEAGQYFVGRFQNLDYMHY